MKSKKHRQKQKHKTTNATNNTLKHRCPPRMHPPNIRNSHLGASEEDSNSTDDFHPFRRRDA